MTGLRRWGALAGMLTIIGAGDTLRAADGGVVISQVYGGGGSATSFYTSDYVELFNPGTNAVSLNGWSVQYASGFGSTWQRTPLTNSIAARGYYLVRQATSGSGLPLPDAQTTGTVALSATAGKVALVNVTNGLTGFNPLGTNTLVDFVGYGSTDAYEGAGGAPLLATNLAAFRAFEGFQDTDSNTNDFTAGAPAPRNAASPLATGVVAVVGTELATGLTGTGAVLNASVTTHGVGTAVWMEWGAGRLFNQSTAVTNVTTGTNAVGIAFGVSNLVAGRVYTCRAVASNVLGVVRGREQRVWVPVVTLTGDAVITNVVDQAWVEPGTVVSASPLSVSAGGSHGLALKGDGRVVAWGFNVNGETNVPAGVTNAVAVAGGINHSAAVLSDGRVVSWGFNGSGQTNAPASITNAVGLAAGSRMTAAVLAHGQVSVWGTNTSGQTNVPAGVTNAVAASAGDNFTVALLANGRAVGWGTNSSGQTNVPVSVTNAVAVGSGQNHSLAVLGNGTVVGWGTNNAGQVTVPPEAVDVALADGGVSHSTVLRRNGTPFSWGTNNLTQTNVPAGLTNAVDLSAGNNFSLVLCDDGTVRAWGSNTSGQTNVPAGLTTLSLPVGISGVVDTNTPGTYVLTYTTTNSLGAVATAQRTVVVAASPAIGLGAVPSGVTGSNATMNGGVNPNGMPTLAWFEWGVGQVFPYATVPTNLGNGSGEVAVSAPLTNLVAGRAYHYRVVASNALGMVRGRDVRVWAPVLVLNGRAVVTNFVGNPWADPGAVATASPSQVAAGADHSLALRADGVPVAWGVNSFGQTNVPAGLSNVVVVIAGGSADHSMALRADGVPVAWGFNTSGQTNVPVGLSNAVQVAAGGGHNLALLADGSVQGWGTNSSGQLNVPAGLTNVAAVGAGGFHSLALRSDGRVVAWGTNSSGQTNVPAGLTNAVAVAGGSGHSLAQASDGRVVAWGSNASGQTNVPPGLSNVVLTAAGVNHSMTLPQNGRPVAWGQNTSGETNVPSGITNAVDIAAGEAHNLVLLEDGTITCWGTNFGGQLNVPPGVSHLSLPVGISGVVDNNTPGTYVLTYTTTNALGAVATALRTVIVAFQAKIAAGLPPTGVTGSNATMNGSVNPNGETTLAWFEWGVGRVFRYVTAPTNLGNGTNAVAISAPLTNLIAGRAYHYRVVASTAQGLVRGPDVPVWAPVLSLNGAPVVTNLGGTPWVDPGAVATASPRQVAAGGAHSLALRADGVPVAWGSNTSGQTNVPVGLSNAVQVAAGGGHNLALLADGTVQAWGANSFGETNVPAGLSNIVAVSGGASFSLALRSTGAPLAWGRNTFGQTNVPAEIQTATAIAAGDSSGFALLVDGSVQGWGGAFGGAVPPGFSNSVVAVAGGNIIALALRADGVPVVWGNNSSGQTNVPSGLTNALAVDGGSSHSLALRADGVPVAWGANTRGQTNVPAAVTNAVDIAAGTDFNLALGEDGTITGWGTNFNGQLNVPPGVSQLSLPVGVSGTVDTNTPGAYVLTYTTTNALGAVATTQRTVIVSGIPGITLGAVPTSVTGSNATMNGGVNPNGMSTLAWFEWGVGQVFPYATVPVNLGSGINAVAFSAPLTNLIAGRAYHYRVVASNALGMVRGRDVRVWAPVLVLNGASVITNTVGTAWADPGAIPQAAPQDVEAGGEHSLVLRADGRVVAWGSNVNGQTNVPAGATNVVAAEPGAAGFHTLGLRADGRVVAWGRNTSSQTNVPGGLVDVVAVAAGVSHSLALRASGVPVAWGNNASGQTNIPASVTNAVAIGSGSSHCLALLANGSVRGWGSSASGQITVPPAASNGVVAVDGGDSHSLALRADGTVVAWGANFLGQTNVPAGVVNALAASAGRDHNLALLGDGTVVAWGANTRGQTNVPPGLSGVVAVAAGTNHSLALREDGVVYAWGTNIAGQLDVPSGLSNLALPVGVSGVVDTNVAGTYVLTYTVTNSVGAVATVQRTVMVTPLAPTVTTLAATGVTALSATLNASVQPGGVTGVLYFSYGTTTNYGLTSSVVAVPAGATNVLLSMAVTNLSPGTTYHFRATASNSVGLASGSNLTFSTPYAAPVVTTVAATGVTARTAILGATINPGGDLTYLVFEYGPTTNYGWSTFSRLVGSGVTNMSLTQDIWGLVPGATYHFRARGSNSVGVAYGADFTFTPPAAPLLGTGGSAPSGVTGTAATFNGAVNPNGQTTAAWFEWGVGQIYPMSTTPTNLGSGTNAVALSATFTNLVAGRAYHYRVVASNAFGVVRGPDVRVWSPVVALSGGSVVTNAVGSPWVDPGAVVTASPLEVGAAYNYAMALRPDGQVVAWGDNNFGQTNVPVVVSNVVRLGIGYTHNTVITADRKVIAWGDSALGQTNVPSFATNAVAVAAGAGFSVAAFDLQNEGEGYVFGWGDYDFPPSDPFPTGIYGAVDVAAGGSGSVALRADGTVIAWGSWSVTNVPAGATNAVEVAAGGSHAMARLANGRVVAWGDNTSGQTNVPAGVTNAAQVAGGWGNGHSVALLPNGRPVAWGNNVVGQTNVPGTLTNAVAVAAGVDFSVALREDGAITCWGTNNFGQLNPPASAGILALPVGISGAVDTNTPGTYVLTYTTTNALGAVGTATRTVVVMGPVGIASGILPTGVTNSTATMNGSVNPHGSATAAWFEWGVGRLFMQTTSATNLGSGTESVAFSATFTNLVPGRAYHYRVVASNAFGVVRGPDVRVWTPMLTVRGDVTMTNLLGQSWSDPGAIPTASPLAVAAGAAHSLVLRADGRVVGWGNNTVGQTNIPSSLSNVTAIAAGGNHNLAVTDGGRVVVWGLGTSGQTNVPAGLSNVVAVAGGGAHCLALRSDGSVVAWGANSGGQTNVPAGATGVVAVAAGGLHNLALLASGRVVAWGTNSNGQTNVPASVTNAVAVGAGSSHSLAVRANGAVAAWGLNTSGQTNVPLNATNAAYAGGGLAHNVALRASGTVRCWGDDSSGQAPHPFSLENVVDLGVGGLHNVCLFEDGHLYAWGEFADGRVFVPADLSRLDLPVGVSGSFDPNVVGTNVLIYTVTNQLGGVSTATRTVVVIAPPAVSSAGGTPSGIAGSNATFQGIVTPNGFATTAWFEWGVGQVFPERTTPVALGAGTNAVALSVTFTNLVPGRAYHYRVAASNVYGVVRGPDVRVWTPVVELAGAAVITNAVGQPWVDPGALAVALPQAVAAGPDFSLALKADGRVAAWGNNSLGQTNVPASVTNVVALDAGQAHVVALGADGRVIVWGNNTYGQTNVPAGLTNVIAVAAGYRHSTVLRADGTVAYWGDFLSAALDAPIFPAEVEVLSDAVAIAGGGNFSAALRRGGEFVGWGDTSFGQFAPPDGIGPVAKLDSGYGHVVSLREDGTVIAWGFGVTSGVETNVPSGLTGVLDVAAGYVHSLAITSNGAVVAWGGGFSGETNVPPGLTGVVAISAGAGHSLALQEDGTITGWGTNGNGQITIPGGLNTLPLPVGVSGTVNTNTPGTYMLTYTTTNALGAVATAQRTVVISALVPVAVTLTPDAIGSSNATLRGEVNPGGDATTVFFDYGTTTNYGNTTAGIPVAAGLTNVPVNVGLNGLAPGTTYHYRARATNSAGTGVGGNVTFETIITAAPVALTSGGAPSGVTASNATMNASVIPGGPVTLAWFEWGVGQVFPYATTPTNLGSGTNAVAVSASLTNLIAGRAYHYRVVASNALGVVRGPDVRVWAPVLGLNGGSVITNTVGTAWADPGAVATASPVGISAGSSHSLALRADGVAVAWGDNGSGQTNVPAGLTGVVWVAGGNSHSLVVRADGTVRAWGLNTGGQTNVPAALSNVVSVAGGALHNLALRSNGTVAVWGTNSFGQTNLPAPAAVTNVLAVGSGSSHSLAVLADGRVVAWGGNLSGQTNVPPGVTNAVAVTGGGFHSLALRSTGRPVAWGNNSDGRTNVPATLTNVVLIAAGGNHNLVLPQDGRPVAWGNNVGGQTNVPAGLSNVVAIAAGAAHSLALREDGTITGWGTNSNGQLTIPAGVSQLSLPVGISGTVNTNAPGTNVLTYTVTNSLGAVATVQRTVVVVASPLSGYASWAATFFGTNAANPLIGGTGADPDTDGVANLLEYAAGRQPLTRDAVPLATTNDGTSLFVIYPRSTLATDVTLRAWASSNLLVWSTNTVTEQLLTDNGTNQVWRASTPTSNQPALFLRLNATQP